MTDTQQKRGRKPKPYVDRAVNLILESDKPISTSEIVDKLGLDEMAVITMRRGLRNAIKEGVIKKVSRAPDDSFAWLPNDTSLAQCAAHAANLYLLSESAELQIDPDRFEAWVENETSTTVENSQ